MERFELPGIGALNFLLYDCLAGGASRSLRIDTQGKLLGTAALEIPLPKPQTLKEMVRPIADPVDSVASATSAKGTLEMLTPGKEVPQSLKPGMTALAEIDVATTEIRRGPDGREKR